MVVISFITMEKSSGQASVNSTNDSLVFEQVIVSVLQTHPTVKAAEDALNAADAKIALAKSGILPNVDASASYSRGGFPSTFYSFSY